MGLNYERIGYEYYRRQRRTAIGLIVVGLVFSALGVFISFFAGWFGAMIMVMGLAFVLSGFLIRGNSKARSTRILAIFASMAMTIMGVLAFVAALVQPEAFGHRGSIAGILIGILAVGGFGTATIILILREIRHRG